MYVCGGVKSLFGMQSKHFLTKKEGTVFIPPPFGERIHADITLFIGKILYVYAGKFFLFFQNTLEILKAAVADLKPILQCTSVLFSSSPIFFSRGCLLICIC